LENEGRPKFLDVSLETFAIASSTNLIKLFTIDKKSEIKQKSLSRYFVDENNKSLGNIRAVAINKECSKVALLSHDSFGIDQKKLWVYFVDTDTFICQNYERSETLLGMQWDTVDTRLLAIQIENRNEKDSYDNSKRAETYFVTQESGIQSYEKVTFKDEWKALVGLKTPHFIFETNFTLKEAEEEQQSMQSMR